MSDPLDPTRGKTLASLLGELRDEVNPSSTPGVAGNRELVVLCDLGDEARRCSLGLIDLRAKIVPGSAAILAPGGVLKRLPDGRFAPTIGLSTFSAAPRPAPPGDPPRSE